MAVWFFDILLHPFLFDACIIRGLIQDEVFKSYPKKETQPMSTRF